MVAPLPLELYTFIVAQVARKQDLRAVALSSRTLRPIAEPELYRCIHIRECYRFWKLCASILSSPTIGSLVRELMFYDLSCPPYCPSPPKDWHFLIPTTLARLPNLTVLRLLRLRFSDSGACVSKILSSPLVFSLLEFECDLVLEKGFMDFLSTQNELRKLTWWKPTSSKWVMKEPLPPLSPDALPALCALHSQAVVLVTHVLPGRSISHLELLYSPHPPELRRIQGSSLKYLKLPCPLGHNAFIERLEVLPDIAPNLATLGVLCLRDMNETVLVTLARFPHLRTILCDSEMYTETATTLSRRVPSLRTIVYPRRIDDTYIFIDLNRMEHSRVAPMIPRGDLFEEAIEWDL